jgi:hypothetical protein
MFNTASHVNHMGLNAGERNTNFGVNTIGYNANFYNQGIYVNTIGHKSNFSFKSNIAGNKTFDYTAIDTTAKTITIPSHGFGNAGAYVNLLFTQGTSAITGISNGNVIQVKIVDANTLLYSELLPSEQYRYTNNITGAGTGTGHTFTPQFVYSTLNIFGSNLEPTKGNQNIISGGEFLMPQSTVATLDADTTNKTLITKEWFTAKAVSQSSINTQLTGYATLAGTQTFTGTNTFTQNIIVPTATLGSHAVNLNQLSDYVKTSDTVKVTITGITQDVTHNFNTYDIVCEAYDTLTLYNLPIKYKRKNLNTVTIEFDNPVPNSIRLMITKK